MSGDVIEMMLGHARWANGKMLTACAPLSEEEFGREFEIGPGSLRATLTHIVGTMRWYGDILVGGEMRPRLEGTKGLSVTELTRLHEEAAELIERGARMGTFAEMITGTVGNRVFTVPRGGLVAHVMMHSMHHRAQCLNMLRRLGKELPPSGMMQWFNEIRMTNA